MSVNPREAERRTQTLYSSSSKVDSWEGCRESRRCPRDTYPVSYITKYTSIRRETDLVQFLIESGQLGDSRHGAMTILINLPRKALRGLFHSIDLLCLN